MSPAEKETARGGGAALEWHVQVWGGARAGRTKEGRKGRSRREVRGRGEGTEGSGWGGERGQRGRGETAAAGGGGGSSALEELTRTGEPTEVG